MLLWDDTLITKCRSLGLDLDLYRRYVDDMVIVIRPISLGWRYKDGILQYSKEFANEDRDLSDTERTSRILASIANSINKLNIPKCSNSCNYHTFPTQ